MYRIRSASGNEVSYSSLEEFSAAVRRGEVHPEDEIFHTRANRWLDVKSHPHYRTATTWAGHEPTAAATAPRAPVPPAAPSPLRAAASPAPAPTSSRAQVFERPVVRTAPQTTVRPQLQPAAPAPTVAQGNDSSAVAAKAEAHARVAPPPKTKELAFIDLGNSSPATKPKAMAVEPQAPAPVAPLPRLEPRPVLKLELKIPAPPAPAPAPAEPVAPSPQAQAPAPAVPLVKAPATPAPPVTGPGSEVEFLVMDGGIESPVRTSAGYKTVPEDLDLLFDAPLPQAPGQSPAPTRGVAVAGVPPKGALTNRSGKVPAVQPPDDSPGSDAGASTALGSGRIEADIEIPSGPLLEAPAPSLTPVPTQQPGGGSSNAVLLGGGLVILAVAGALLAWRPWKGGSAVADANAQPAVPVATTPALAGAPAPTPIRSSAAATTPLGKGAAGKPTDTSALPARTDSADEDGVITISKPTFRTDVAVAAAGDFNIGDIGGKSAAATASPTELVRRLVIAEQQTRQELDNRLASAGFRSVLSADRFTSASGVGSARSAWTAGADAIRQYRGRIARLESAYEDSVLSAQRAQRWSGEEMRAWASRQSLAEPAETSQLADLMFSQVNEGLEILAALSDEYTIKGQSISFKNATSATRFNSIRGWVEQRTSTWNGIPETARPYSVTAILHALGEGFPAAQ